MRLALTVIAFSLFSILNARSERSPNKSLFSGWEPLPAEVISPLQVDSLPIQGNIPANVDLYRWSDQRMDWVIDTRKDWNRKKAAPQHLTTGAITITWEELMDMRYQQRFFEELGMNIFAPVFSRDVASLHGTEVIIEGYVIPYAEAGELLSLSANPYASCFFCGKGSPASVMSVYTRKKARYEMDARVRFRGVLYLNHDNPNEFYYILREAEEE